MNWKRPLARIVETTAGDTFATLAEARAFVIRQPDRPPWPNVAGALLRASTSGDAADIAEATDALANALFVDGLRLKI